MLHTGKVAYFTKTHAISLTNVILRAKIDLIKKILHTTGEAGGRGTCPAVQRVFISFLECGTHHSTL